MGEGASRSFNMTTSRLSLFCDRALEAAWLLGVIITPVFFNVYSSRVFEPDKLTTLRSLAVVMAVLWLVRFVDEASRGEHSLRFSMKTPLVLPTLITLGVYLLSTMTSLVPFTSLLGSYQRLQGFYTLFGYLAIFFAILTSLRTRVQLSRLVTVLILNSLPVALYGIIQHNGLDPLPWAGDVTVRVASNMGNAIFVAAYLIMIVPLTAARIIESFGDIMEREETRFSDVLRASSYIFILAVALLTIWYSRSRGPWIGILVAGFAFPYLALIVLHWQTTAQTGRRGEFIDLVKGFGFGLGSLTLAGVLAGLSVWALRGTAGVLVGIGFAMLAFGGLWLHFVVERKGWQWLWIGWGSVGLVGALGLIAVNVPGPLQAQVRQVDALRRLTTITELQSGTGKVRGLIWQGAVELISRHDPLIFPDGSTDKLNSIRPLVGYGPESMYVAYNSFYPPELGHYESRTASPDRSHNETLDALVITGVLGLAAYLFVFGSFFGWGMHWLGLLNSRGDLLTYVGVDFLFAVAFFFIGWRLEGAYLFAVAIPLGILVGTLVYITVQAFRRLFGGVSDQEAVANDGGHLASWKAHPHTLLLIGLLTAGLAHFVEINFGIGIAATRTTFWAYAALLVVLGLQWVPGILPDGSELAQADDPVGMRSKKRARGRGSGGSRRTAQQWPKSPIEPWLAAVIALALVAAFLLGTLAFNFINNPDQLTGPGQIFIRSLTMKYHPEPMRAYGALMVFVFTWALFGVVGLSEFDREGVFELQRTTRWNKAIAVYAGISLSGLLIFGLLISAHQVGLTRVQVTSRDQIVDVADALSGLLSWYYGLIFVLLVAIGWVLAREGRRPRIGGSSVSYGVLVVSLLLSIPLIRSGSYNLVRADVIFKQGSVFANSRTPVEKEVGIQHFERAIRYAPHEDYYYLFLGKAYLELAQGLPPETPVDEREALFLKTEEVLTWAREINPLNTDHSANLARFYKSWAARVSLNMQDESLDGSARSQLDAHRLALLQNSLSEYETALKLSPNNPILWNELAQLYGGDLGDMAGFEAIIEQSLAVDDRFEQTWMLIGDFRNARGDYAGAIEAYQTSLEIRENCTVRRVVGQLLAQDSRWEEAVAFLEDSIEPCETSGDLWDIYRVQAIAYANMGTVEPAIEAARAALLVVPADQRVLIEDLLQTLEREEEPASGTPSPQP
jgi:tetratricopeptide (TPR) repeat protein